MEDKIDDIKDILKDIKTILYNILVIEKENQEYLVSINDKLGTDTSEDK